MTGKELLGLMQRRPFRPFRMTLSTDENFDVTHPDQMIVTPTLAALGIGSHKDMPKLVDRIIWIDVQHIVHVQPIDSPTTAG